MNLKQFREVTSKYPDDTEIYVVTATKENHINKPNDSLYFLEGLTKGIAFVIWDEYDDCDLLCSDSSEEGQSLIKIS